MPPLYKNRFLFFLKLSILFFIFLIILTNIKSPILNKKNFFTLSAKSPEYEIFPIINQNLLVPATIYYPTVSISPNAKYYSFVNYISDWGLFKKKYDSLFYASKTIAELITWGNEISWEKQITIYEKFINKEIDFEIKISDPRLRLDKLILLNNTLMTHQQKFLELLYAPTNKNADKRKLLHSQINKIFEKFNKELSNYLPEYQTGSLIYPLYNPLFDREYGIYEAQFEPVDSTQDKIYNIQIDGKKNFLHWNWDKSVNPPLYLAEINPTRNDTLLGVITYYFPKGAEIRINNNHESLSKENIIENSQDILFLEQLYPTVKPITIKRIFTFPKNENSSKLELYLRLPDLSTREAKKNLTKFSLTFYKMTFPEPKLILTKKPIATTKEPIFTLKKLDPFHFQLIIKNSSFFNGRQVRYNLSQGWQINDQRIIFYLPGIYVFKLVILSIFLCLFYGLCFFHNKPYDHLILTKLKYITKILTNTIKNLIFKLKKTFGFVRFWFFILALFTFILETFFHSESFDSLVFFTAIFWIIFALSYSLESKFSLIGGFISLVCSIIFLFFKQKPIPDNLEIISNKFAIWAIIFFTISLIETIIELTNPYHKSRNLRMFFSEIYKDWYINSTPIRYLKKTIIKLINIYRPKSKTDILNSIVKLVITTLVIIVIIWTWSIYQKYQKKLSLNPSIIKLEPKILYPSTKFILTGKSMGSFAKKETKLMSSYGEINPDSWTDSKIYFTIPLEWKPGKVKIWIKKQIEFEGKKYFKETEAVEIRIIPRSETFTPLDDLFFEQLKTLDKETLKYNGYE